MIITLKVKLGKYWSADIEIDDRTTLDEVHIAIQRAVEFNNDHLFEFFVARTYSSEVQCRYDDQNGELFVARIGDLFPLPPKKSLFYLFDYGDWWIFKILKTRHKPREPEEGVEYPRVVKETGEKPVQYSTDDDDYYVDDDEY